MTTNTEKDKRRKRDALRRAAEQETKHQHELAIAKAESRNSGVKDGRQLGAKQIRDLVLERAGSLYKQGNDVAADAVREAHGLLPTSV
jgi:hypothetical protein